MVLLQAVRRKLQSLWPHLNERSRRMLAAAEATQLGYGGVSLVSRACGLSRVTIMKGVHELDLPSLPPERIRHAGGGRRSLVGHDPRLPALLEALVEPLTRGDPESPLRWTCKSTRTLADELTGRGHRISHAKAGQLLRQLDYSLQSNRKTEEGTEHPHRDAQFRHINRQVQLALGQRQPVISVDTKKKELVGNLENKGRQWRRQGNPEKVQDHDFPDPSVPRAYPYGIYDLARNTGFVNVGTDHDTASFAMASIRGWWRHEGWQLYPQTTRLLITADGGGSNGYRVRLWKWELQRLANQTGLEIAVCHFPPGTSKWNKVEHRLFSFISSNWRGEPLRDYETVVGLIACTTTAKGLKVNCRLDRRRYPPGRKITTEQMASIHFVAQDLVVEQRLRRKFPILSSAQRLDPLQEEEGSAKVMQQPSDLPPDFTRAFRAFYGVSALFTDELFDGLTRYFAPFQGTTGGELAQRLYEEFKSAFPTLGPGDHYQLVNRFAEITGFPRLHDWDPRPAFEIPGLSEIG